MKENSWLLTTNCSNNHANLLMIVASHGFLASRSNTKQAYKIVHQHSNHTSIPHNKLQATINSSKPVRDEHEIKKNCKLAS